MRSPRAIAPPCPEHPGAHTWHDGYYGKRGVRGYFQHPRFRCRPDPSRPGTHGFTNHRRLTTGSAAYCEHCDRAVGSKEGPRTPTTFEYSVVEIARSLYELASGTSYRGTSKLRRIEIDRPARTPRRGSEPEHFSSQGHLARDWLEILGPVVLDGKEATAWPRVLVLDDKGFRPKLRTGSTQGFRIYGGFDPRRQQLVRLAFYPDRTSWSEFLDQLPGEPDVVVADHDTALLNAVMRRWPATEVWRSHWHVQHRLLTNDAVARDGCIPPGHRLVALVEDAFHSEQSWWDFVAECRVEGSALPRLQRWLDANAITMATQIAQVDFVPKSTGGLEDRLEKIGDRVGEKRNFVNKNRTDLLLRLWTLHLNHRAHLDEFIRRIRLHLEANGGTLAKRSRRGGRAAVTGTGHRHCRCHPQPVDRWTATA